MYALRKAHSPRPQPSHFHAKALRMIMTNMSGALANPHVHVCVILPIRPIILFHCFFVNATQQTNKVTSLCQALAFAWNLVDKTSLSHIAFL